MNIFPVHLEYHAIRDKIRETRDNVLHPPLSRNLSETVRSLPENHTNEPCATMDDNFRITLANDSHVDAIFRLAEASEIGSMEKRNEAGGFLVSKFSENQYRTFITRADHFYVMADNERITGFLLAYSNGFIDSAWEVDAFINSTYPQPFVVIKQICIDKEFRRRGLAVRLYEHLIRQVPGHALFAAVVLEPYNYASVRFHERFGFQIVREITPRDGLPRAIWCRDPIDYGGLGDAAK